MARDRPLEYKNTMKIPFENLKFGLLREYSHRDEAVRGRTRRKTIYLREAEGAGNDLDHGG